MWFVVSVYRLDIQTIAVSGIGIPIIKITHDCLILASQDHSLISSWISRSLSSTAVRVFSLFSRRCMTELISSMAPLYMTIVGLALPPSLASVFTPRPLRVRRSGVLEGSEGSFFTLGSSSLINDPRSTSAGSNNLFPAKIAFYDEQKLVSDWMDMELSKSFELSTHGELPSKFRELVSKNTCWNSYHWMTAELASKRN